MLFYLFNEVVIELTSNGYDQDPLGGTSESVLRTHHCGVGSWKQSVIPLQALSPGDSRIPSASETGQCLSVLDRYLNPKQFLVSLDVEVRRGGRVR